MDYLECAHWLKDAIPKLRSERQQFLQGIERALSHRVWECQSRLEKIRTTKLSHDDRTLRKWGTIGIPVIAIFVGYNMGTLGGCVAIAFLFSVFVAPILFWFGITFGERIRSWPESQALKLEEGRLKQLQREFPAFRDAVNARALSPN